MTDRLLGLQLTRSERIIVVTLSYLFAAPLIFKNGKALIEYLAAIATEARRQIREEAEEDNGHEHEVPEQAAAP